ncbi:MAG: 16S rRNA (guanine(966)-N(2))-methyltransferase RsmD [Bacilli bacterium]|nr:16S rRNA (guanine(966)-N(2))-methyltransferase RsmD [Bacilli bacterium]MDD4282482.1 16S rRNA (guanine(966)-N(2))-methyltransferase RsmD [Bacilli bacterium]MDD4718848.1 16S rRNA (guanine(966)-N(2))-methyltransferase RsmD [Bacilli bacterium]
MRVISGKYKGIAIKGFNQEGTRPTMDRVKESLFSMLQYKIKGSVALDLFAGSGALGIEALSNGSRVCYFVESNKKMFSILKDNITRLKIKEEYNLINNDYSYALKQFSKSNIKFDLIFLDPPYDLHLINKVLEELIEYDLLADDGQVVCEYVSEEVNNNNFETIKEKNYGSKKIKVLKKAI